MKVASTTCRSFCRTGKFNGVQKFLLHILYTYKDTGEANPWLYPRALSQLSRGDGGPPIPTISERFTLNKSAIKKLRNQLGLYFKSTGITNKSCLDMMTEHASWAAQNSFATDNKDLE